MTTAVERTVSSDGKEVIDRISIYLYMKNCNKNPIVFTEGLPKGKIKSN